MPRCRDAATAGAAPAGRAGRRGLHPACQRPGPAEARHRAAAPALGADSRAGL